jgi:ABC-type lipoprotein release transport system permease subunit
MLEVGSSGIIAVSMGLAGGLALSTVSVRLIKTELYGVQTYDPLTFLAVLTLLIIAAAAATFLPTRRIANIDPASTLRAE